MFSLFNTVVYVSVRTTSVNPSVSFMFHSHPFVCGSLVKSICVGENWGYALSQASSFCLTTSSSTFSHAVMNCYKCNHYTIATANCMFLRSCFWSVLSVLCRNCRQECCISILDLSSCVSLVSVANWLDVHVQKEEDCTVRLVP